MNRPTPTLHRDDPNAEPLVGNVKATRADWLNHARNILITDGEKQVKILTLANRLGVSRSSFYWYFKSREDLLDALLSDWADTNPGAMVRQASLPARSIHAAICNFFHCVVNPALFDTALDFAVRDWARRAPHVRARLDQADHSVISALRDMFARHGYADPEAITRARVLFYMQLGYHSAEVSEPMVDRIAQLGPYLQAFSGTDPDAQVVADFTAYALAAEKGELP
ncbi:TetR/AcrR family transcriptional regulator [Shimia ponticola]|uniref:TetR/AcrR family transcriptional regulator n=1 Tax=Shimia ponticola TaxID=2582893 RepID=UPI0011BF918E|nr:TetR/AcrR family transcriptional regulator [Shimia ponticola]